MVEVSGAPRNYVQMYGLIFGVALALILLVGLVAQFVPHHAPTTHTFTTQDGTTVEWIGNDTCQVVLHGTVLVCSTRA